MPGCLKNYNGQTNKLLPLINQNHNKTDVNKTRLTFLNLNIQSKAKLLIDKSMACSRDVFVGLLFEQFKLTNINILLRWL